MTLPRTPDEIADRIREVGEVGEGRDLHGAERSRLLDALPYELALEFLRPDHPHDEERWEAKRPKTAEELRREISDYLPFAWSKANACRGNSALRSLSHFLGLVWLLGEENAVLVADLEELVTPEGLVFFGKSGLVSVSELVGFDWREADNGMWRKDSESPPVTSREAIGR